MKNFAILALAVALVTVGSYSASAQPAAFDVGIFSDAAGTTSDMTAAPFAPFNFYVVAFDLTGGVLGYEFGMTLPPTFTLLTTTLTGPAPLNVGNNTNVIVGTGGCVQSVAGGFLLTNYNGGFFSGLPPAPDTVFCIGGTTPSSFGGVPGYLQCDSSLVPFGVAQRGGTLGVPYPDGCLVINPTQNGPVAIEATSFGDVKARF